MRSHCLALVVAVLLASACGPLPATNTPSPSAADEEDARSALSTFFQFLNEASYNKAVLLYGGPYDSMRDNNPSLPPTDLAALMRNACEINGVKCLRPMTMTLNEAISENEFLFDVEFKNPDGSLFIRGPCCGASPEDQPPQSVFPYRVIRNSQGSFLVMDMPPYVP